MHDLVMGSVAGTVALAFGLIPGWFDDLTEGVQANARREAQRQVWLAGVGALLAGFTIVAYILN